MTAELGSLKFGRTSRCKPAKFIKIWNSFQQLDENQVTDNRVIAQYVTGTLKH